MTTKTLSPEQLKQLNKHVTAISIGLMQLYDGLSDTCIDAYNLMDEITRIREITLVKDMAEF